VQHGDEALVSRVVRRAVRIVRPRPTSIRRTVAARVALAAVLFGAAAGAWAGADLLERWVPASPSATSVPDLAPSAPPRAGRPARGRHLPGAVESAEPAPEAAPELAGADEAPSAAADSIPVGPVSASGSNAGELFAAANLARRQGRSHEALRIYERIVRQHPGAREAPLARLTLAKLLSSSAPHRALAHFQTLARSGGPLRAEALWGTAECARRLGRRAVEKRALDSLLREYPASAYAEAARGRSRDAQR